MQTILQMLVDFGYCEKEAEKLYVDLCNLGKDLEEFSKTHNLSFSEDELKRCCIKKE